jgi:CheY-like chemotaxis protein
MAVVLYVDDDPDDRYIFEECFEKVRPEFSCLTAESADAAIAHLEEINELPICIFIDINMPLIDGLQTLRLIKSDSRMSGVITYMFSTATDVELEKDAIALGASGLLVKPNSYSGFCGLLDIHIPKLITST